MKKFIEPEIEIIELEDDVIVMSNCHGHCISVCPSDCIEVCNNNCINVTK